MKRRAVRKLETLRVYSKLYIFIKLYFSAIELYLQYIYGCTDDSEMK